MKLLQKSPNKDLVLASDCSQLLQLQRMLKVWSLEPGGEVGCFEDCNLYLIIYVLLLLSFLMFVFCLSLFNLFVVYYPNTHLYTRLGMGLYVTHFKI